MNPFAKISRLREKFFGTESPLPARLDNRTRAGVVALLLLTPAAALWSKHLDNVHDADSLLTSLISLQKLTLFYWGANRFGNLLPFLTAWIHDINLNFQAQVYLRAFGCASIPLLVFAFIGLRRHYLSAYAIALALSFLPFNDTGNAVWTWITPYGHSIPPFLGALLLHQHNNYRLNLRDLARSVAILFLVCVALYVNGGLIIFAFPLWFVYAVLFPRAKNWWFVAILLAAYVVYTLLSTFYGQEYHDAADYSRMTFSAANMAAFWNTSVSVVSVPVFVACLAVTGGGLTAIQWSYANRRDPDSPVLEPLVLRSLLILPTAAIYIVMFANMDWVAVNNHSTFRYFWFPLVLVAPVCAAALTQGIPAVASRFSMPDGIVIPLIACGLLATAIFRNLAPFEIPSSFVMESRRTDALALAGLAHRYGATYVAGDYYYVWPAVFESVRVAQATGDPAPLNIRGLGLRGEHLRDEMAASLRSSEHVVVLGTNLSAADCYGHALFNNAVDWPPYASLVAGGNLPAGGTYCVLAFDRKPPAAGAARLPRAPAMLMAMLIPDPQCARWDQGKIAVAATGHAQKIWSGPSVNVPAGKYTVAFEIESQAGPSTPLCELMVTDGFGSREYSSKKYSVADLQSRNGGTWATIDFTVPESSPTRVLEFGITTSGNVPFTVNSMELHRQQ